MKSKTGMALMGLGIGVGSAAKTKAISDLENMM